VNLVLNEKGRIRFLFWSEHRRVNIDVFGRWLVLQERLHHLVEAKDLVQICLCVLLIGRTESGLTIEPITSALVICQLLTAPLFAWFLELRSVAKQSARPIPPALGAKYHISLAETRMKVHPLPSRTVRQPVLHPL